MLLQILDANGVSQTIVANAQEAVVDGSGTIAATGVAQWAILANPGRSGFIFQNNGENQMILNELGPAAVGSGSFVVKPGDFFPPPGYPVTSNAWSVLGTTGDAFTAREW